MRSTHDYVCDRNGVFDKAVAMIKEGKRLGYHVTTNTTVFKETSMEEVEELCALVADLGVDGMLIAPGYHYESVDLDIFPVRQEIHRKPAGSDSRNAID
jgi:MoaA/NifB/PqqE/SkfB family radical SAM enzyme